MKYAVLSFRRCLHPSCIRIFKIPPPNPSLFITLLISFSFICPTSSTLRPSWLVSSALGTNRLINHLVARSLGDFVLDHEVVAMSTLPFLSATLLEWSLFHARPLASICALCRFCCQEASFFLLFSQLANVFTSADCFSR